MAGRPAGRGSEVAKLVERQMRNWELSRAQRPEPEESDEPAVEEFVAISRMVGAGGHQVALALGEELGWPVFDREILQMMAGDDHVRRRLYEDLDERDLGWIEDSLRWLVEGRFRKDDYFHRLSETILAIARQGRSVFLGRGADLVLPPDRGLRVHLISPHDQCTRNLARRLGISETEARAEVERIQHERTDFLQSHFGRASVALTRHDLILNTGRFKVAEAVSLICHALRERGVIK